MHHDMSHASVAPEHHIGRRQESTTTSAQAWCAASRSHSFALTIDDGLHYATPDTDAADQECATYARNLAANVQYISELHPSRKGLFENQDCPTFGRLGVVLAAVRRWLLPVRFVDRAMEKEYHQWNITGTCKTNRIAHVLLLLLVEAIFLSQIRIGLLVTSYEWLLLCVAWVLWAAAGGLLWLPHHHQAAWHVDVVLAAACTLLAVCHMLVTTPCGLLGSADACAAIDPLNRLMLDMLNLVTVFCLLSIQSMISTLQVRGLVLHLGVAIAVWCSGAHYLPAADASSANAVVSLLVPIALTHQLLSVCIQQHLKHATTRAHFYMLVELAHQLHTNHAAMEAVQKAHDAAISARIKALRADTIRDIHDAIMGYVCHQLRNPLHALRGLLEQLKQRCLDGHPIDHTDMEDIVLMDSSAAQLARVADDVLDFQMLQNGTALKHPQMQNIRALASAAVYACNAPCITACEIDPDVPAFITTDGERLTQLLMIGLSNAIKYRHDGSEIRVLCRLDGNSLPHSQRLVRFEVWNEGEGLGTLNVQQLFEPYSRPAAEQASTFNNASRGLGLGLPIARLIAEMLGGHVGLEDRQQFTVYWFTVAPAITETRSFLGSSATLTPSVSHAHSSAQSSTMTSARSLNGDPFIVGGLTTLTSPTHAVRPDSRMPGVRVVPNTQPLLQPVSELSASRPWTYWGRQLPKTPGTTLFCLVVDDLRTNRRLLSSMLQKFGHHVDELEDGDQIFDYLTTPAAVVDVLLLDVHMVRTDGRDVTKMLREQGRTFPIIAVTGNVSSEDINSYFHAGFDGVLGKPFNSQHLFQLLAAAMHRVAEL